MVEHRPLKDRIQTFIDEIMVVEGISGCAMVTKDGIMMGRSFDKDVPAQAFAAMSATMIASGEAAASLVHLQPSMSVIAESMDGFILVMGAGERALIATVISRAVDLPSVKSQLVRIAGRIGEEF